MTLNNYCYRAHTKAFRLEQLWAGKLKPWDVNPHTARFAGDYFGFNTLLYLVDILSTKDLVDSVYTLGLPSKFWVKAWVLAIKLI